MTMPKHIVQWIFWPTAVVLVFGTTYFLWQRAQPRRQTSAANAAGKKDPNAAPDEDEQEWTNPSDATNVKTVHPRTGATNRITVQVGTVETDEVQVHAQVTGVLKSQEVNIGERVKAGSLLAEIDVPELREQVKRNAAVVEQAKARVQQMEAKVKVAKADLEAEKAQIVYAEANARAATAWLSYRSLQFARMKYLVLQKSVEDKLEDEAKERYEAARESETASKAAILATKAKVLSAAAKIDLADADVVEAKAQVKVAEAELAKSTEQVKFAQITAPFDGIITHRPQVPGSLVRSATQGAGQAPLLTIQRTDRMRVIVQIPDSDVPFADPGDRAFVEINAFPGVKFETQISRIAKTEDPKTRLMQIEIDLPNPEANVEKMITRLPDYIARALTRSLLGTTLKPVVRNHELLLPPVEGKIRQGMFGTVTIFLERATDQLSIPSSCLAGKSKTREGTVYVLRDGKARKVKVTLGPDNGARVVVLAGLKDSDEVILAPPRGLPDGLVVQATAFDETLPKDDSQP